MLIGVFVAGVRHVVCGGDALLWIITLGTFLVGLGWSGVNISAPGAVRGHHRSVGTRPRHRRERHLHRHSGHRHAAGGRVVVEQLGLHMLGFFGMALMGPALIFLLRLRERYPGSYEGPNQKEPSTAPG